MTVILFIVIIFFSYSFFLNSAFSQKKLTREEYINRYKDLAIKISKQTGIPVSIILAQACLESDNGNSLLATKANNHFGIKCGKNWSGEKFFKDDDEKNECFRKYSSIEESYYDYANYLKNSSRYKELFLYDSKDYSSWAKGLKEKGYATNPNYANLLIKIIEENELYKYDQLFCPPDKPLDVKLEKNYESLSIENREIKYNNGVKYIIAKDGDNLETIAKEFNSAVWLLRWYNDLIKNKDIKDGDIIYLEIKKNKAEKGKEIHIVQPGETLHFISQLYAVKLKKLKKMNCINDENDIKVGDTLYLRSKKCKIRYYAIN